MKLFDKYRANTTSEEELETMTQQFIKQQFDQELRQKMASRLRQDYKISREEVAVKPALRRRLLPWTMSIAATLLIGVVAWQLFTNNPPAYQSLTRDYLAYHYPNHETRKGATDLSEQRAAAIAAYNKGDFATSARLRAAIVEDPLATTEDYFFLGISYLYQDPPQGADAIEPLLKAATDPTGDGLLKNEIDWYLALAYVEAGQFVLARQLLDARSSAGGWNADKARDLLKKLPQ